MTLRNLFTISAIIALLFGLADILAPAPLFELYGITLSPAGLFIAQLFGVALISFAVLNWQARDIQDTQALRAIVLVNLVHDVVGFVIVLLGQLNSAIGVNALGWSTVALYGLLALAFGYFQLMRQSVAPASG